jgi:hypothetical protein
LPASRPKTAPSSDSGVVRTKKILSVALHPALAETRSLLIRSLGSEVKTVSTLTELQEACQMQQYDLLIISQGISINEKRRIVTEFRQHCEGTPILEMFDIIPDLPDAEFHFQASDGPQALTAELRTILGP